MSESTSQMIPKYRRTTMERKIQELLDQGTTINEKLIKDSVADAYREATKDIGPTEAMAIARQLSIAFWIASQPLDEA